MYTETAKIKCSTVSLVYSWTRTMKFFQKFATTLTNDSEPRLMPRRSLAHRSHELTLEIDLPCICGINRFSYVKTAQDIILRLCSVSLHFVGNLLFRRLATAAVNEVSCGVFIIPNQEKYFFSRAS
jgi:hypothetical protein